MYHFHPFHCMNSCQVLFKANWMERQLKVNPTGIWNKMSSMVDHDTITNHNIMTHDHTLLQQHKVKHLNLTPPSQMLAGGNLKSNSYTHIICFPGRTIMIYTVNYTHQNHQNLTSPFSANSTSTTEHYYDLWLHQPMFTEIVSISRLLIYSVLEEAYEGIQSLQIAVDRQAIFALHYPQVLVVCQGRCGRTMTTTQQIGWFKTSKPLKWSLHSHRMDTSKTRSICL